MRNLAIVGLKLLGVLGIYWAITGISQILFFFSASLFSGKQNFNAGVWVSWGVWLLTSILSAAFAAALLARTDWIVAKFKFPEDPPPSGMEPSELLRVGFVVLGAFSMIEALPEIGRIFYATSAFHSMTSHPTGPNFGGIISPALKFILGCVVIGKSDRFAKSVFPAAA